MRFFNFLAACVLYYYLVCRNPLRGGWLFSGRLYFHKFLSRRLGIGWPDAWGFLTVKAVWQAWGDTEQWLKEQRTARTAKGEQEEKGNG